MASKENDSEEEWNFQASLVVEEQEELAAFSITELEDTTALITVSDKLINYDSDWIVDLGCSNHMTRDQGKLSNMSEYIDR